MLGYKVCTKTTVALIGLGAKASGHELYLTSFSKLVIGLILDRFGIKLVSQIFMELSGAESLTTSPKAHWMSINRRKPE